MINKPKPHISQSQLGMYETCGEAYRRRYVEGEIIPPGFVMLRGIGVHAGSKANFTYKIKKKRDMRENDIVEMAVSSFEEGVKKGVNLTRKDESIGKRKVRADTKDKVVLMSHVFAQIVAPIYDPLFVEEEHRVIVPDCSHDLMARMDLCDTKENVVDTKTSTNRKSQKDVDHAEQGNFYSLCYKAKTGRLPNSFRYENLTVAGQRILLISKKTTADLLTVIHRINTMIRGIKAGIYIPSNPLNWKCSPDYCGYWYSCKYVRNKY